MNTYARDIARHQFESDVLKSNDNKLKVVEFWAPWCGPCKALGPELERIARKYEYKIDIYKINIDDESELASFMSIKSVPTMILFKNGLKLDVLVGNIPPMKLEQNITKNM